MIPLLQSLNLKFYLCQFVNSLANCLDPIVHKRLQKWLSNFTQSTMRCKPRNKNTLFRRTISPPYQLNLPNSSHTLNHTHMQYLQPQEVSHPSAASTKIDPTLHLLGFHPSHRLPKAHAKLTNEHLSKLYYHHSNAYTNICKLLRSHHTTNKEASNA